MFLTDCQNLFLAFHGDLLQKFGPVLINNLDTKHSREFTGYEHRIRVFFKWSVFQIYSESKIGQKDECLNVQARVFPMRNTGSKELVSRRESSSKEKTSKTKAKL